MNLYASVNGAWSSIAGFTGLASACAAVAAVRKMIFKNIASFFGGEMAHCSEAVVQYVVVAYGNITSDGSDLKAAIGDLQKLLATAVWQCGILSWRLKTGFDILHGKPLD